MTTSEGLKICKAVSSPLASAAAYTAKGPVREANEDRCGLWRGQGDLLIAVVSDGMGSYQGGALAADTAVQAFAPLATVAWPADKSAAYESLLACFYEADEAIRSSREHPDMGATVVAAIICERGLLFLYAGDARCYILRDGRVLYRSSDHSILQVASDLGMSGNEMSDRAGSIVTSCVGGPGAYGSLTVDPAWDGDDCRAFQDLRQGDQIVLCSDGLWNMVSDDELAAAAFECSGNPSAAATQLILRALERGGDDNVTAIAIDIASDLCRELP